jgi:Contractile injection system tube protein/LysM domain
MTNLTFVAYKNETFTTPVGKPYEVMLNPDKLQWDRSIKYNDEAPPGSEPSLKYKQSDQATLSFDLVIDCTGVVDSDRVDLPGEIKKLSDVIYKFNGDIHQPNYIKITWGGIEPFNCVLTKFNTSYTFFKPDGTPLRAKLSLSFANYLDLKTIAQQEKKKSPDMTHLVTVVEGDDLPQISKQIYRSSKYYIQIAQANGLDKFRRLKPGLILTVPPLVPEGANNA